MNTTLDQGDLLHHYEQLISKFAKHLDDNYVINTFAVKAALKGADFTTSLGAIFDKLGLSSVTRYAFVQDFLRLHKLDADASVVSTFDTLGDLIFHVGDETFTGVVVAPLVADSDEDDTDLPDIDKLLGILFLPSLEDHGRMILVENVTVTEAKELVNEFDAKVRARRKLKIYKDLEDSEDNIEFFHNFIDIPAIHPTKQAAFIERIEELTESKVPTYRGLRALYVNPLTVGTGTSVIYNQNWATVNFSENGIGDRLIKIGEEFTADHDDHNGFPAVASTR